jgi:hypothetical protein
MQLLVLHLLIAAFHTIATELKEFKVCCRLTLINIYNKQHYKIKVNYIEIEESRQLIVKRRYP